MERNGNETKCKEMKTGRNGKKWNWKWEWQEMEMEKWKDMEMERNRKKYIYIYNIHQIKHGMKMKTHGNGKTWKRQETGMKKNADGKEMERNGNGKDVERNGKKC